MLKIKKTLTGPKALQIFINENTPINQVFKHFMKWFLEEKYLRHAISEGTMNDLSTYIQFKNSVIMNILQSWYSLLYYLQIYLILWIIQIILLIHSKYSYSLNNPNYIIDPFHSIYLSQIIIEKNQFIVHLWITPNPSIN